MKFTFRKERAETGLNAVGNPTPSTQIKLGGMECGIIRAPNWMTKDGKWSIGLTVEDEGSGSGWRWVFFRARFDAEPEAREWLRKNAELIASKWQIHCLD